MQWTLRTLSKRTWTALLLTTTVLGLLLTLARHMLLATLCFASTVIVIFTHTTTPGRVTPAHVCATTVALFSLATSSLSRCLGLSSQIARVTTSAFTTGMSGLASSCSWSLRSLQSTCSALAKGYSTAHTPLCQKTLSAQFSDL